MTKNKIPHLTDGVVEEEKLAALMSDLACDSVLLRDAVEMAKDTAASLGILLRHSVYKDVLKVAPLTLFPTVVPQPALEEILQLQSPTNLLMHDVAHDWSFLKDALGGAAASDSFVQNLMAVYLQVDVDSQWELGFIRSDYQLSRAPNSGVLSYKQVEVNMTCIGLAALGTKVDLVHDRVLRFLGSDLITDYPAMTGETLALYGEGLHLAYDLYCRQVNVIRARPPVMLVVIHDGFEFNIMDQRQVEFATGLVTIRRSFRQIAENVRLDETGCLFVDGREVAVVYYRTGYSPDHYKDRDWEMRLLMEKSKAIKCPSVAHQLAGFKKIQQMLSRTDILRRFIPDQEIISRLQETYVGQWDLSEPETEEKIEEALREPEKFVLKPNREGGGNNVYGPDIVRKIKQIRGTPKAQDYILMELIPAVVQPNVFIRAEMPPQHVASIGEIGIFGVILARNRQVIFNKSAREVLMRCKAQESHEGGLSTGHACISSVLVL